MQAMGISSSLQLKGMRQSVITNMFEKAGWVIKMCLFSQLP